MAGVAVTWPKWLFSAWPEGLTQLIDRRDSVCGSPPIGRSEADISDPSGASLSRSTKLSGAIPAT